MAQISAQVQGPALPFALHGSEAQSQVVLKRDITVVWSSGAPNDSIKAASGGVLTPALVNGSGLTIFDRTRYVWIVYTVLGSGTLSIDRESNQGLIAGTFGVLARVILGQLTEWQVLA